MDVMVGGIYEISDEWHPYDTSIVNHRPVIVIAKYGNNVEIVLMGALHYSSNKETRIMFEVEINGRKHISTVACDRVHLISVEYLKTYLGYIKEDVLHLILYKREQRKLYDYTKMDEKEIVKEVVITDTEKFIAMVPAIEENTKKVREILEKKQRPIQIWKERIIGFAFGILASVIASFIWEVRSLISDFVFERVNWVISLL